jgi:hypothetical protein
MAAWSISCTSASDSALSCEGMMLCLFPEGLFKKVRVVKQIGFLIEPVLS